MHSGNQEQKILEMAMKAGKILLENGAEIHRIEETMGHICQHYGVTSENTFVLSNGIFTTIGGEKDSYYAKVQHIPVRGTQLDRVAAVNQLSREIEERKYSIEEVEIKLDEIQKMPGKNIKIKVLASGIGSACFCYLFGGEIVESTVAFFVGCVLYLYVLKISAPYLSKIVGNIMGGALVTFLCVLMYWLDAGEQLEYMIIGSIMPLIPGVAFTNGIRDIAEGDYIAGLVRLVDATLIFLCIAVGVGFVIDIYQRIIGGIVL